MQFVCKTFVARDGPFGYRYSMQKTSQCRECGSWISKRDLGGYASYSSALLQ